MSSAGFGACCTILVATCLAGCITRPTAYEHCLVNRSNGWVLSTQWPADRDDLLGLLSQGKTVREQLSAPVSRKEVWFKRGPDGLTICRYQDIWDTCASSAETTEFRKTRQGWLADAVLEKVCVTADKRY